MKAIVRTRTLKEERWDMKKEMADANVTRRELINQDRITESHFDKHISGRKPMSSERQARYRESIKKIIERKNRGFKLVRGR